MKKYFRKNRAYKKKKKISKINYPFLTKSILHSLFSVSLSILFGFSLLPTTSLFSTQQTLAVQNAPRTIKDELQSETSYTILPKPSSQIIFHGDRMFKKIALTFDADMTAGMEQMLSAKEVQSYYDENLIHILEDTHTKATLFLTGMWIEEYPDIAKQLAQNPLFELANHSYDHKGMDGTCYGLEPVDNSGDIEEVDKTQKLLAGLGVQNSYFRFPGGCYSQEDLDILSSLGITAIQWDVAGVDGFNDDEANIEDNVLSRVQNGSIIIMHMNGFPNEPKTADATRSIITQLRLKGFEFVTVSELLSQ